MSNEERRSPEEIMATLGATSAFFNAVGDIGERYIAEGKAALELLKAKAAVEEQIAQGTHRSLAKAEMMIQEISDKYLGGE